MYFLSLLLLPLNKWGELAITNVIIQISNQPALTTPKIIWNLLINIPIAKKIGKIQLILDLT